MKTLRVNTPSKSYNVLIDNGLFINLGTELKRIYSGKKVAVITDDNLKEIYGERLKNMLKDNGYTVNIISVKPGESSKSLDTLANVYSGLSRFNITRKDMILTFGGGVVGDLGGFAAATFLRGIRFIQVPTSLLAQVDSSIGGKVAVDLNEGKNLVGAFYQPEAVFIDTQLLETLPLEYLQDGLSEVIKYGAIRDEELFYNLLRYNDYTELKDNMEYIIYTCCNIKREIVERDEKDTGERMILNFGHTIGHIIEKYFNYDIYTHGRAVAIGMYNIAKSGERIGYTKEGTSDLLREILQKYNLPFKMPSMDLDKASEIILMDKKNEGEFINFIFIKDIGGAYVRQIENNSIKNLLFREGC